MKVNLLIFIMSDMVLNGLPVQPQMRYVMLSATLHGTFLKGGPIMQIAATT